MALVCPLGCGDPNLFTDQDVAAHLDWHKRQNQT